MSLFLQVVIVGLGGWRLASLLVREEGPGEIFLRIRDRAGVPRPPAREVTGGFLASLLDCIWCTSVFTTSLLWLLWYVSPEIAALPAAWAVAMGSAIVMDRVNG